MSQTRIGRTTGIRAGRLLTQSAPGFSWIRGVKDAFHSAAASLLRYRCLASGHTGGSGMT